MSFSRRALLRLSGAAALGSTLRPPTMLAGEELPLPEPPLPAPLATLKPMTAGIPPISLEEHRARLVGAQRLMAEAGLDAIAVGPGTSLTYFTGAEWGLSERFLGFVLTREGDPAWVTPAFEKQRALEQIRVGTDVRPWEEHESPYDLVASILRDRKVVGGRLGIEETMPFVFADGIAKAAPTLRLEGATPVTAGCRVIKDSHEVALMRRAGQITVCAHRAVFASLKEGMTQSQVSALSAEAHRRLGVSGGSLVLFGANAAYPHGTKMPRPLKTGDVVLIDGGGSFLGYKSDITRTGIFGAPPTPRQREVWELVRRAQEAAFGAARPGVECQAVDAAARKVITDGGFGPAYKSFTHRLGHGIGMDGHEWTYLVRGNATKLRPGMCFSNEPGVYLPGEMGIRHEDVMTVTAEAVENLTKWSGSPEDPAVI
jgi:Xaa-Pro dipeptidase